MTVTVALLRKALIAILAHEGPQATVHADVVHHVTEFGEGVSTGDTHQQLVRATGVFVLGEQLHVAPVCFITVLILVI